MFDCCFKKLFFVLENRKHSKTCLTIVPLVFKFVLHVLNLIFLKNNLKLYPPFSILWIEQKNKKNKQTTCKETQTKNREERQKKKTTCREQTTNPPKMHHTTNWTKSQIHTQTLKFVFSKFIFFFPNFLLQMRNQCLCWWWWQCCNLKFAWGNGGG